MTLRYCPKCGKPIRLANRRTYVCRHCGFTYYRNAVPANAGILTRSDGAILLTRRARAPRKGSWNLPGGFLDLEESMEQSLYREMQEELGVRPTNVRYLASFTDRYLFKGDNYHMIVFVYTGQVAIKGLRAADDVSEIRFFKPRAIPWKELSFANDRDALRLFLRSRTGKPPAAMAH